jgi:hypothetical protein
VAPSDGVPDRLIERMLLDFKSPEPLWTGPQAVRSFCQCQENVKYKCASECHSSPLLDAITKVDSGDANSSGSAASPIPTNAGLADKRQYRKLTPKGRPRWISPVKSRSRKHSYRTRPAAQVIVRAETGHVRKMVVFQGMRLALARVLIGIGAAIGLTRVMATFLFGVKERDLAVFIVVPVLLSVVSFIAVWLPARRATMIDPVVALRAE